MSHVSIVSNGKLKLLFPRWRRLLHFFWNDTRTFFTEHSSRIALRHYVGLTARKEEIRKSRGFTNNAFRVLGWSENTGSTVP